MPTRENIRLIARTPSFVVPFIIERCMRLNILSSKPYLSVILGVFAYLIKDNALSDMCDKTLCISSF